MVEVAQSIDLKLPEKLKDRNYRKRFFLAEASARIAQQLIALRKKRNMNQIELAKEIGTKQPAISRVESSDYQNWSFSTLRSIADALDARIRVIIEPSEDILHEYEEPKSESLDDAQLRQLEFQGELSGRASVGSFLLGIQASEPGGNLVIGAGGVANNVLTLGTGMITADAPQSLFSTYMSHILEARDAPMTSNAIRGRSETQNTWAAQLLLRIEHLETENKKLKAERDAHIANHVGTAEDPQFASLQKLSSIQQGSRWQS